MSEAEIVLSICCIALILVCLHQMYLCDKLKKEFNEERNHNKLYDESLRSLDRTLKRLVTEHTVLLNECKTQVQWKQMMVEKLIENEKSCIFSSREVNQAIFEKEPNHDLVTGVME